MHTLPKFFSLIEKTFSMIREYCSCHFWFSLQGFIEFIYS